MVYRLLYYLVNILIRVFYRKIQINGLENIERDQAYIITSNHPNGFFEPLIMACTFPIDLHFLVRGDLFENPISNWFLRSTHQIPIYRFVDGFSKMKENQSSMGEATKVLSENKAILVFAEGSTLAVMKLRPIQKGSAKLAFQALEEHPDLDLEILPVGINFSNWCSPGSEVILNIGKSFKAAPYYTFSKEEKPRVIRKLTKDIEAAMNPLIFNIDEKSNEDKFRKIWQLLSFNQSVFPRVEKNNSKQNSILHKLSISINTGSPLIRQYIRLHDQLTDAMSKGRIMGQLSYSYYLLIIIGLPGLIFYAIPVLFGKWMRDTKVKRDAFKAPIFGIGGFVLSAIFHLVALVLLSIFFGILWSLIINIVLSISGFCFVLFWENLYKKKRNTSIDKALNSLNDEL